MAKPTQVALQETTKQLRRTSGDEQCHTDQC